MHVTDIGSRKFWNPNQIVSCFEIRRSDFTSENSASFSSRKKKNYEDQIWFHTAAAVLRTRLNSQSCWSCGVPFWHLSDSQRPARRAGRCWCSVLRKQGNDPPHLVDVGKTGLKISATFLRFWLRRPHFSWPFPSRTTLISLKRAGQHRWARLLLRGLPGRVFASLTDQDFDKRKSGDLPSRNGQMGIIPQKKMALGYVNVTPHSCESLPVLLCTGALRGSRWQCYVRVSAGNWMAGRQRKCYLGR